ncbi:MAG: tripartite tricarboxylate transporter substrate-binding protein [Burkholderiales bacterium]|nr:tripartite tricarboxylate transporter substrate-binding protein [Burkholderiales bacterium]MDP2400087.1 tripartite tricarboxylate transporter substrate-binding protein [Burkholderiales bacterium]MDP3715787.1 tripartite tricarboxylate transporter substrate-binding protein [Burkholderiales bacterium]
MRDMPPLSPVITTSSLIMLHPSMAVKILREFVAFGSTIYVLMAKAGIKTTRVAYKGAGPTVSDVVARQIQGMFVDLPVISPYVKPNQVEALALGSAAAFSALPRNSVSQGSGLHQSRHVRLLRPAQPI